MELAGEAGSLLKIEEEIRGAVENARDAWVKLKSRPAELLTTAELNAVRKQAELDTAPDLGSLTADFWTTAENRLLTALREFAEQAENGGGFQRRLFAEDAARGFAFIDVCRKRYDVALMNPPFGESTVATREYFSVAYPMTKSDLYAAFVEHWLSQLVPNGRIGAITSRLGFFLVSFFEWRTEVLLRRGRPVLLADLGYGVLDNATVETAAYVVEAT